VKPAPGQSAIATQAEITTLSDANFRALRAAGAGWWQATDVKALVLVLPAAVSAVPSRAYEDLGYPGKYFNDRLVEGDRSPACRRRKCRPPIRLVQPKVFYEYADTDLESRSAGPEAADPHGSGKNARRHQGETAGNFRRRDRQEEMTLPPNSCGRGRFSTGRSRSCTPC